MFFFLQISLAKAMLLMDDGFSVSEKEGSERINFNAEKPVACWTEEDLQVEVSFHSKAARTPNAISLDASEKERLLARKRDC